MGTEEILLNRQYPAKVLLFGEYGVLEGSMGLAIPFAAFHGRWVMNSDLTLLETPLLQFIEEHFPNSREHLNLILQSNLRFTSDIPIGKGLGSSGALSAALYELLTWPNIDPNENTIEDLKKIESYFHGKSSGIDPMISLLNKAVKLGKDGSIEPVEIAPNLLKAFHLVDSGLPRNSKALIDQFLTWKLDHPAELKELIQLNDTLVQLAIKGHSPEFLYAFIELSRFQINHLDFLIPSGMKTHWEQGLRSASFYFKLCGAGGGGYFLVYFPNGNASAIIKDSIPLS